MSSRIAWRISNDRGCPEFRVSEPYFPERGMLWQSRRNWLTSWVGAERDKHLFLNRWGRGMEPNAVWAVVHKYAKRAGIEKPVSTHSFRHACATHMLRNAASSRRCSATPRSRRRSSTPGSRSTTCGRCTRSSIRASKPTAPADGRASSHRLRYHRRGQEERAFLSAARPSRATTPSEGALGEGSIRILPGQYLDKETGLFYNYFRDYDPQTGRYVQHDPEGLSDGPNPYAYAGLNPLAFFDPDGRSKISGQKSIGGNDPIVSGITKNSPKEKIDAAIKAIDQTLKDPSVSKERKGFLRAWKKVAKRGFTSAFCLPLLEPLAQALAREQCLGGDRAACQAFLWLGGEIIDPNEI